MADPNPGPLMYTLQLEVIFLALLYKHLSPSLNVQVATPVNWGWNDPFITFESQQDGTVQYCFGEKYRPICKRYNSALTIRETLRCQFHVLGPLFFSRRSQATLLIFSERAFPNSIRGAIWGNLTRGTFEILASFCFPAGFSQNLRFTQYKRYCHLTREGNPELIFLKTLKDMTNRFNVSQSTLRLTLSSEKCFKAVEYFF